MEPMTAPTIHPTYLVLLPAILIGLTSCRSTSTNPPEVGSARIMYTKGVPGGVLVQTVETTAMVSAIDHLGLRATIVDADGRAFAIKVSPEAVEFTEVQVGDMVNATLVQEAEVALDELGSSSVDSIDLGTAHLPNDTQSDQGSSRLTEMTARIIAIDSAKRTATVRFEDGNIQTFPVRPDTDLSKREVGELVKFRIIEMLAIRIERLR
jgi:hypothetical protein